MGDSFSKVFLRLTGFAPLSWQTRLYKEHFVRGELPPVVDIPTGLGKTMIMAIWFIAREQLGKQIPTRLIYVVDRRTVVDQATDLAEQLRCKFGNDKLTISTLRGQLADNRQWSADPSRPAIIIGTVDLIGSALLFSGYRSSYKRRPLEAGLIGQDSLLVLDEAHLSKPFEKLVCAIKSDGQFQKCHDGNVQGTPMRVIRMSATSGSSADSRSFTLRFDAKGNLTDEDAKDTTITERFSAKKRLTVESSTDVIDSIAYAAGKIAAQHPGSRIVIFVRSPKDVEAVRKALIKKDKSRETRIAQLTGTIRGLERDELVTPPTHEDQHERKVMQRFLYPDNDPSQGECFLISTSAGEVGFDLNANHLVGDASPLDSWIQRLGRVNRRGNGDATVILIKEKEPTDKTEFDAACIATSKLLTDGMDVSLKALAAFKNSLTPEQIDAASSPKPTMVELTDILLDAWSMTSIVQPMPGRPEVGPWLRGIADELPQTTIAWRAELELLADDPDPKAKFKAVFATHRVRPHESLTTNSNRVVEFLQKITKDKGGRPELKKTRVVLKLSHDLLVKTIGDLIDNPGILNAEPTLILPATFGGLDNGMLSHDAIPPATKPDAPPRTSFDVADIEGYESHEGAPTRWRILLERTENGWKPTPLRFGRPQGIAITERLGLDGESHSRTTITSALRAKLKLRVREIVKFDLDEESDPRRLLLLLSGISQKAKRESQPLDDHIGAVETEAQRIANDLKFREGNLFREALLFAAKWHDEGKRSQVWQRFIGGSVQKPLGKSASYCDPKKLAGYRHEFGSLLRVLHPDPAEAREKSEFPADESVRELALHLIAVHHGHGRPQFENPIDRDFHTASLVDEIHTESIRRFARLQSKYGWWHLAWLENLLRCADAIASAQVNDDENQDDEPEAGE